MSVVHKYIFLITDKGIKTYEARKGMKYEIKKHMGEEIFKGNDLKKFFEWFDKVASITKDDRIDYCILSEHMKEWPGFEKCEKDKISSWKQKEILSFLKNEMRENYEIIVDEEHKFIHQVSNLPASQIQKKLYLKCIPEFAYEDSPEEISAPDKQIMEEADLEPLITDETSTLNRYFIEMLKKL